MSDDGGVTVSGREYVTTYGGGAYGSGYYGGSEPVNNVTDLTSNWTIPFVSPYKGTNVHTYLRVLASQLYRVDVVIDDLYDNRFITSATNNELNKLAEPLGVERRAGENDDSFRSRALAAKQKLTSRGTYEDVVATVRALLRSTAFDIVPAETAGGGICRVETTQSVINDTPYTEAEIEAELDDAVPRTHNIVVSTNANTFTFSGTDEGAGFGEGEWA